ncbi:hypothetical protein ACFVT5_37935 [Streptomyces sp. NPDC058001]|uniref:hypothetical protein n=1 Tax=Streptomyces sp. NPDC058001 TaxID=3346300 RepID=UPI0036E21DD0
MAAEDGDPHAMVLLAEHFHRSDQAERAETWARAAAEMGDPSGMVRLSRICTTMAHGGRYYIDLKQQEELRGDPDFERQSKRWSDEAARWIVKAAEAGHSSAVSSMVSLSKSAEERERWLRLGAAIGDRHIRDELLSLLREQRRFEEAEPWQRAAAEDGEGSEQLRLAQRLLEQGHLDEAEHWFRTAAGNAQKWASIQAAQELARLLRDQGREDEADHWRRRATEIQNRPIPPFDNIASAPAWEATVITALVTTTVLPFIQTLVSKTAEDAYAQARQLIRRLPLRHRETRNASGAASPSRQAEAQYVIVDDSDADITLYLSSDVSDEALRALAAFDLSELTARRPDAGRVRLVWHQPSGTWRIRGETDQPPRRPV